VLIAGFSRASRPSSARARWPLHISWPTCRRVSGPRSIAAMRRSCSASYFCNWCSRGPARSV
jgi:hypothetical protein